MTVLQGLMPIIDAKGFRGAPYRYTDIKMALGSVFFQTMLFLTDGKGLRYKIFKSKGEAGAKMVAFNKGFDKTYWAITSEEEEACKLGFRVEISEEDIHAAEKLFAQLAEGQIDAHLDAAAVVFDGNNLYGGIAGTAYADSPFRGRHKRMLVGSAQVINMLGTGTGGNTSVYIDVYGPRDCHGFLNTDAKGVVSLLQNNVNIWENVPIVDDEGKEMNGNKIIGQGYYGLAVHDAKAMAQIYNIDDNHPLTGAILKQAYAKCDTWKNDRAIRSRTYLSRRAHQMLMDDVGKSITQISKSDLETGLDIYRYENHILVVSDVVSDNEPEKPAA